MSDRRHWLDGWRGCACLGMAAYHLLFDLYLFGYVGETFITSLPMQLLERAVAWSFILCAGISSRLSGKRFRRGLMALLAGGVVTAVSYLLDTPIKFGILQFLGVAMLLCAVTGKYLDRLPAKWAALWLGLFAISGVFFPRTGAMRGLFWLGLPREGFVSYDYFPVIPYLFLFLTGRTLCPGLEERLGSGRKLSGVLELMGRHSLLFYLLHQPVLYGLCLCLSGLV